MLLQAAGFALLAAVSPTALLVLALFLGSDNPRRTAMFYLAGALITTAVMAVTVLLVLRWTGLNQPRQHAPRYGFRLGLGVLALAAGVFLAVRKVPPPDPGAPPRGLVFRLVANPRPVLAFAVGVILFVPSLTFISAIQVIATAQASTTAIATAMLIVIALTALIVWLPLLAYLAAPDLTARKLTALNGWLRANGRKVLSAALLVCGVALVLNGTFGLIDLSCREVTIGLAISIRAKSPSERSRSCRCRF